MHTWPVTLRACSRVHNRLVYNSSAPRLLCLQTAVAKQGYEALIALDAVHEIVDSTTKDM
jgi:hypothetical protein